MKLISYMARELVLMGLSKKTLKKGFGKKQHRMNRYEAFKGAYSQRVNTRLSGCILIGLLSN